MLLCDQVLVEGAAGDASKVTAAGPGLEKTGVTVNQKTHFEVYTKGRSFCYGSLTMIQLFCSNKAVWIDFR